MSETKFELIIENGVVTGYKGQSKVIEIPEGVTEIGEFTFQECCFIEEVHSKSSVLKTIGMMAFENCKNLKVCNLKSLKGSIESNAFSGCESLKSFDIPNGTIKIGNCAFDYCKNLLYVVIPSSVFIIEGYILEIGNKKTVILGDIGSEAEEYARSKMLPFKENTPATRNEFLQLENKKDNTGYKDFNIFGETVRCYKSVIVYQELLDFFKYLNSDFSKEVINSVTNDITVFNDKSENLINLTQVYAEKTRAFLQKYGVFISDTVFKANTLKYEANYLEVCSAYIDVCNKCVSAIREGKANLQSDLIAEAKSKVTGLSYGVIGDSLTMVAYAIDDYRARKRQINEAYDIAASKLKTGTNQIINQTQNIYANLLNDTLLPAFDKSVAYICDGLMQLAIEEMIEAKVIDKKVFEIYDIAKSNKLIEQAKRNANIDKKYAIATALKLYPLNVDAIILAIKNKLVEKDLVSLIEFYELDDDDKIFSVFENNYTYIELVKFYEQNALFIKGELLSNIKYLIAQRAKDLLNKINDDYDPMLIDVDTWNELVKKYTIIYSINQSRYNISEDEVKGLNGRELLSKAIAIAREEKRKAEEIRQQKIREQRIAEEKRLKEERKEREEAERLAKLKEQQEKEKKQKKVKAICLSVVAIVFALSICFLIVNFIVIPNNVYNEAMGFVVENNYVNALEQLNLIKYPYKDSEMKKQECYYFIAKKHEESNDVKRAAISYGKAGNYQDAKEKSMELWNSFIERTTLDIYTNFTVGVRKDGTVIATGYNAHGECNVDGWNDIIDISISDNNTIGLKSNGMVVATGSNFDGQCNVYGWNNIIDVVAGNDVTFGLKLDGSVVAVGMNGWGQCDIGNWKDIIAIGLGEYHTVGLKSDGTVVATGKNESGQCNVNEWTDIVQIQVFGNSTVGLKSDGTVVAVGDVINGYNLNSLDNIVDIDFSWNNVVGLKSDGTVVALGENENGEVDSIKQWTNIVDVVAAGEYVVGIKSNGTTVAVGNNEYGELDIVNKWTDIVFVALDTGDIIGLKTDGTIVSSGSGDDDDGYYKQRKVNDWKEIQTPY